MAYAPGRDKSNRAVTAAEYGHGSMIGHGDVRDEGSIIEFGQRVLRPTRQPHFSVFPFFYSTSRHAPHHQAATRSATAVCGAYPHSYVPIA